MFPTLLGLSSLVYNIETTSDPTSSYISSSLPLSTSHVSRAKMSSMGAPGSYFWLAALVLLLAFTVIAVEEAGSTNDDDDPPIHMFPLTKRDLEHAIGLEKRSDEIDLASLSLADKHEIFFGGLTGQF